MSSSLNWIDRTISYVSPLRGLQRAQARAVIGEVLAYEAARKGRTTSGWSAFGASADAEIESTSGLVRNRGRDLVRNNAHAKKGRAVIVSNKIGTGIMVKANGSNKRVNERINERMKRWQDNCDYVRQNDFFGIQSLTEGTRCESGETLIRFIPVERNNDLDVPIRLHILEPDHIDTALNKDLGGNAQIRYGIEYAGVIPVAYWLFDTHPGATIPANLKRGSQSVRVPADEILHVFKVDRPGQTRGISDFAPVMLRLRALDDYDEAEVMRKKIAACLAAFVMTPGGLPAVGIGAVEKDVNTGRWKEGMSPGMIHRLRPGETVQMSDPKPSDDYKAFNSVQLHAVAAGLGVPYELLTGDLAEVTYTSHRGGLVQFRGQVEADQWQLIIPRVVAPICNRFQRELSMMDSSMPEEIPWKFTPPRFGLLDPSKEIPAMIESIRGGVMTYDNVISREGYDPEEQLNEIRDWQRRLDKEEITMTSDARVQLSGAAPAPDAAPPQPTQGVMK